ncbi:MAG: hypothetical protein PHE78_01580 [Candidatus Gastranaerophilales bacterium]|nr:hypothetical protein [Candidatus Gastranaerophilales bacterium]
MKRQNQNNILILILLGVLSFGFNHNPSFAQFSELQTKTIKQASQKTAILPSKYGLEGDKEIIKTEKEAIKDSLSKMLRALVLALALFLGLVAILIKKKGAATNLLTKFQKHKSQNQNTEENTIKIEKTNQTNLSPEDQEDKRVKDLVFKFFEVNK